MSYDKLGPMWHRSPEPYFGESTMNHRPILILAHTYADARNYIQSEFGKRFIKINTQNLEAWDKDNNWYVFFHDIHSPEKLYSMHIKSIEYTDLFRREYGAILRLMETIMTRIRV